MNHTTHPACTVLAAFLAAAVTFFLPAPAPAAVKPVTAASDAKIVPIRPGLKVKDLAANKDTDVVELSGKRRISVGSLRRLEKAQQKMLSARKGSKLPKGLQYKPSTDLSQAKQLKGREDLKQALQQPDSTTVVLPDGKTATVGQVRFVMPEVEKRLGRKLGPPSGRPDRSGKAIRVSGSTSKGEWIDILKKPDNTVIESSANNRRITVGELKQFLKMRKAKSDAARKGSVPASRKQR